MSFSLSNMGLLTAGLLVLALSIVVGIIRVSRARQNAPQAGIFSVLLSLVAAFLIIFGLLRMTFPALGGANPLSAVRADTGRIPAGVSQAITSGNVPAPAQTQVAQGTVPPRLMTAVASGAFTAQSSNVASIAGPRAIPRPLVAMPLGAAAIALAGLILFTIERKREGFNPARSPGLLYAGVGVLALVAALLIPGLPGQFSLAQAAAQAATPTDRPAPTRFVQATATPSDTPEASATPSPLPTLTETPQDSPTALMTSVAYVYGTTSSTTGCTGTSQTIMNLRGDPSANQAAVGRVFAGTLMQITGQTYDNKWLNVSFSDGGITQQGWVSGEFVTLGTTCGNASIPKLGPTLTPSRTPRPSRTPSFTPTPRASPTPAGQ